MKALRYIITRPCLQEGSLRLLKYLEGAFPSAGPVTLIDDHGGEHHAQVDLHARRITGLNTLYHAQNLGVNDVLMISPIAPGRYQVEAIVKPHAPPPAPRRDLPKAPETRRVVVSTTPHVREVRLQEVRAPLALAETTPTAQPTVTATSVKPVTATTEPVAPRERPTHPDPVSAGALQTRPAPQAARTQNSEPAARPATAHVTPTPSAVRSLDVRFDAPQTPAAPALPAGQDDARLAELARLTGYRMEDLGSGVLRLNAELGAHSYAVLVATSEAAVRADAWKERADYCVLLTDENDRTVKTPRLTREALEALLDHAQLAPLTPVDLRGYWKAGSVDLEAAASVAELVGAHLAQRGAFSAVLLTLAQQPAHSLVSVQRLAERLGSGVNYAELGSILDTLTRAPFLALTPLPGGQYLLRSGVNDLLAELSEYAEGLRRRTRVPTRQAVLA